MSAGISAEDLKAFIAERQKAQAAAAKPVQYYQQVPQAKPAAQPMLLEAMLMIAGLMTLLVMACAVYPQEIAARAGVLHSAPLSTSIHVDGVAVSAGAFDAATSTMRKDKGSALVCASDASCVITSPAPALSSWGRAMLGITAMVCIGVAAASTMHAVSRWMYAGLLMICVLAVLGVLW